MQPDLQMHQADTVSVCVRVAFERVRNKAVQGVARCHRHSAVLGVRSAGACGCRARAAQIVNALRWGVTPVLVVEGSSSAAKADKIAARQARGAVARHKLKGASRARATAVSSTRRHRCTQVRRRAAGRSTRRRCPRGPCPRAGAAARQLRAARPPGRGGGASARAGARLGEEPSSPPLLPSRGAASRCMQPRTSLRQATASRSTLEPSWGPNGCPWLAATPPTPLPEQAALLSSMHGGGAGRAGGAGDGRGRGHVCRAQLPGPRHGRADQGEAWPPHRRRTTQRGSPAAPPPPCRTTPQRAGPSGPSHTQCFGMLWNALDPRHLICPVAGLRPRRGIQTDVKSHTHAQLDRCLLQPHACVPAPALQDVDALLFGAERVVKTLQLAGQKSAWLLEEADMEDVRVRALGMRPTPRPPAAVAEGGGGAGGRRGRGARALQVVGALAGGDYNVEGVKSVVGDGLEGTWTGDVEDAESARVGPPGAWRGGRGKGPRGCGEEAAAIAGARVARHGQRTQRRGAQASCRRVECVCVRVCVCVCACAGCEQGPGRGAHAAAV